MPKPASLVETKGWNSGSRTKSRRHAAAAVDHVDGDVAACSAVATSAPGSSGGGVDRVLDEMWPSACSSAAGSRQATSPAWQLTNSAAVRTRFGGGGLRRSARSATRAASAVRPRAPRRKAGEQIVHLARPNSCSVATMSARNSGLSAWRSALRATQAELAHQILDVVHDEGEAAVELVEALGVGQRLLAAASAR